MLIDAASWCVRVGRTVPPAARRNRAAPASPGHPGAWSWPAPALLPQPSSAGNAPSGVVCLHQESHACSQDAPLPAVFPRKYDMFSSAHALESVVARCHSIGGRHIVFLVDIEPSLLYLAA